MKKTLLTFLTFSVFTLGAVSCSDKKTEPENPGPGVEGLVFGYCGNVERGIGNSSLSSETGYAAICIPEMQAEQWKGCYLQAINVGIGTCSEDEVTVFLSNDLEGEPFYSETGIITVQNGWNVIKLDTPYEITGAPFYVGYSVPLSANDKPVGVDGVLSDNENSGWVNLYNEWENISDFYGNVCIRLSLIGDQLPQYNVEATSLSVPPLVQTGSEFTATLYVTNNGVKTVNDVTLNCKIGDMEVESPKVSLPNGPIPSGEMGEVEISGLVSPKSGEDIEVSVTLLTVNGENDETPDDNNVSAIFSTIAKTYKRNVVIEEFTGLWCGNCPIGIVAMAYMKEKYGDDGFIGIAGHYGDVMQVASYVPVVDKYGVNAAGQIGLPACNVNRSRYAYPAPENMEYFFLEQSKYPVSAGVTSLTATYNENSNMISVTSEVEFGVDYENASYSMAYVIIEDNFGPYEQENYFSGGTGESYLEGWSNKPAVVETYFNEVVRDIKNAFGISGSIPSKITALTPVTYSTDLSAGNVVDIDECEVIALLLDTSTGEIVNAAKVEVEN